MASEHCCGCGGGNRGQGDAIQSDERGSEEIVGVTEMRLVPLYTVSGWAWDVQRVAFMTEEGELTREQGCEVFDSGSAGADIGYGPENAFCDSGAIWGGRQDNGGVFYIGLRCDSHHRIVSVDLQQPSDTHFAPEVIVEGKSNDGPFAGEWHTLGFEFADPTPERVTLWSEGEVWADEQQWPSCASHTCNHGMQLVINAPEVYCHEWGCDEATCCYQAASQTEGCADVPGWSDSVGDSCHSYVHNGWCHDPSNFEFAMNGHTGDTACCACGGGLFHEEAGCAYHHESCEVVHHGCINNHEHQDFVGMECDGDDHRATCQMLDGEFLCVRCGAAPAPEPRLVACENPGHTSYPDCFLPTEGWCDHGRVRLGYGERWSEWVDVDGSFECSNGWFGGDPFPGQAKACECESEGHESLAQMTAATKMEGDSTDLMQTHNKIKKTYTTKSSC
jgi:hypothetical protein